MTAADALFDVATARALDARASALLGDDGTTLMEQAGLAAWHCLLQHWPRARRIRVVCGPGNNGGDGLVLARHAHQAGRAVQILLPQAPSTSLARGALQRLLASGAVVHTDPASGMDMNVDVEVDVLVDAVFGIGLSRPPVDAAARWLQEINAAAAAGVPVLALDVPSGVDAGTGDVHEGAVRATVTLQFIVRHLGLHTGAALEHVGRLQLASLQLPAAAWDDRAAAGELWRHAQLQARLPPRRRNTHKGESGHALCIGGNLGGGGAVMLAAEAALRSGAGLVTVATRAPHVAPLLSRLPEAMVHAVEDGDVLRPLLQRRGVIAIGPGLGRDAWAEGLWHLVRDAGLPLVVDADALNLLAVDPRPLPGAVLTPHPAEAARLLGSTTAAVQADRLAAANALAGRYHAAVVLKGAGSIITAPGHTPRIIAAGNPGMAVGGMGDLLTGIIAGLRAQGLDAFDAAATGALLHALAGDAAATDGQRGLLPTDLLGPLRRLANP